MALIKKTLAQRLFDLSKSLSQTCRLSTPSVLPHRTPKLAPDRITDTVSRRFLHQSTSVSTPQQPGNLVHRLRSLGLIGNRICLDGLTPPPLPTLTVPEVPEIKLLPPEKLTVEDARKVLRVSQLETIKSKIRGIKKDCVIFEEFVEICSEDCGSRELGTEFANMLDGSGHVIVLGKFVFLRPEQVVKVVQGLMPSTESQPNDPRWKELEEMENQKLAIDLKAESLVRKELWCGLGYLIFQTAAFMRLTFWELTWDVMEPICFYVTSVYFMGGYAFFLRTKIEPSFEGFFQSRFSSKQKKLMKKHNFDIEKYNELLRAFYPGTTTAALPMVPSIEKTERARTGAFH